MFKSKAHYYLYTFCRYFAATTMLLYAFAKLFGVQLMTSPSIYDTPIGELSGIALTWFFYNYSFWYVAAIGSLQVLASLLLFFKKTTRLGAVLYLPIIGNILIMDFVYEISALQIAALLTTMILFILLSDFQTFFKFFIQQDPLFTDNEQPKWVIKIHKLKYLYIPVIFIAFFILQFNIRNNLSPKDELSGAWSCEQSDAGFDRLYFESNHTFKIYKDCETKSYKKGEYNIKNGELTLNAFTKSYIAELDSTSAYIEEFDKSKMETILKSAFTINSNILTVFKDGEIYSFKRIR